MFGRPARTWRWPSVKNCGRIPGFAPRRWPVCYVRTRPGPARCCSAGTRSRYPVTSRRPSSRRCKAPTRSSTTWRPWPTPSVSHSRRPACPYTSLRAAGGRGAGVTPQEASAGLGYAVQAETVAKGELDKIGLAGSNRALIMGHEGDVTLVAENGTDYVVTVELRLTGEGVRFPQGDVVKVRLEAGGNEIAVPVVGTSSSRELTARLIAGTTVLDERSFSTSLRHSGGGPFPGWPSRSSLSW